MPPDARSAVNRPSLPSAGSTLVLIVDDDEDSRQLLEAALTSVGYATMVAADGREALALLARRPPDLVLLDWLMPVLSGMETLRAIRLTFSTVQLPVIMCSAVNEEMSVVAALGAGASDYITKPISLPILRARIAAQLAQRDTAAAAGPGRDRGLDPVRRRNAATPVSSRRS